MASETAGNPEESDQPIAHILKCVDREWNLLHRMDEACDGRAVTYLCLDLGPFSHPARHVVFSQPSPWFRSRMQTLDDLNAGTVPSPP